PAKYAPFAVQPVATGLATLTHPEGASRFTDRWNLLHSIDANRTSAALGKASMDMNDFYDRSKALMDSPGINSLFSFTATPPARSTARADAITSSGCRSASPAPEYAAAAQSDRPTRPATQSSTTAGARTAMCAPRM